MQRAADATPEPAPGAAEPLISIAEAAREIGVNKSTLSRQVISKAIRSHDGKVRLSEVLEDRANNINQAQSRRRSTKAGKSPAIAGENPAASSKVGEIVAPRSDATTVGSDATVEPDPAEDIEIDLGAGEILTFVYAQRVKETYLAKLRQLDFRRRSGELVERSVAEQLFFSVSRENRDSWLSWPAGSSP
jgi:hypothetical protein